MLHRQVVFSTDSTGDFALTYGNLQFANSNDSIVTAVNMIALPDTLRDSLNPYTVNDIHNIMKSDSFKIGGGETDFNWSCNMWDSDSDLYRYVLPNWTYKMELVKYGTDSVLASWNLLNFTSDSLNFSSGPYSVSLPDSQNVYLRANMTTSTVDSGYLTIDFSDSYATSSNSNDSSFSKEVSRRNLFVATPSDILEAYPNPSSSVTELHFRIYDGGDVALKIYDLLGRVVKSISKGELSSGNYIETIASKSLLPGSYVVSIEVAGKSTSVARMVITR